VVDQNRDDEEQEPAHAARRRRLATTLVIAAGVGSGAIAMVIPTVGAALGVLVAVLAALDQLTQSRL
jgi:hypothetical protein